MHHNIGVQLYMRKLVPLFDTNILMLLQNEASKILCEFTIILHFYP